MPDGFDYACYQQYMAVSALDLRLIESRSLQEARGRWGIRNLSPSQLEDLANVAARDPGLHQRWRERLTRGYQAEKRRLEDEIEESFARIPTNDHASAGYGDAA